MLNATGPMEKKNGCSCRRRFAARIGLTGTALAAPDRSFRRYIRCVPSYEDPYIMPCRVRWSVPLPYYDALRANNYFSGSLFDATSAKISADLLRIAYPRLASGKA